MTRNLLIGLPVVFLMSSCDPFQLVEPRPDYRTSRYDRQQPDRYRDREYRETDPRGERDPRREYDPRPERDNRPVPDRYPMAERTDNPDLVISPFAPYNVIDVSGYNAGQLVRDPTNNEIFRIP